MDVEAFRQLPGALRTGLVEQVVRAAGGASQGLLSVHHESVRQLASGTDGEIHLPNGILVSLESGWLRFRARVQNQESFVPQELPTRGRVTLPGGVLLQADRLSPPFPSEQEMREAGGRAAFLDAAKLCEPLVVRAPRQGDRFQPFGMSGTQKLHDFFVNAKVPRSERQRVLVVEDQARIVWIAGYRTAEPVRVTRDTKSICRLLLLEAASP